MKPLYAVLAVIGVIGVYVVYRAHTTNQQAATGADKGVAHEAAQAAFAGAATGADARFYTAGRASDLLAGSRMVSGALKTIAAG